MRPQSGTSFIDASAYADIYLCADPGDSITVRVGDLSPDARQAGSANLDSGAYREAVARLARTLETRIRPSYPGGEAREVRMQAEGWYRDPWLVHEDRWFSAGQPTKLVRDRGTEDYDPPPDGPPEAELVEARHFEPGDGSDLRRADDPKAGAIYDAGAAAWGTIDSMGVYGPRN